MTKDNKKTKGNFIPKVVKLFYPLYIFVIQLIRTNPLLIKYLFKARLLKNRFCKGGKVSWDFTTLTLKHALKQRLSHIQHTNISILEIGVGQAALLCIYLARKFGIKADGVDIIPQRVERSKQVVQYNSLDLRIWQSDFFQQVVDKYDLIFWNASYIPTSFGKHHQLTGRGDLGDQRAWDGGSDGTRAIQRFLTQAPSFLAPGGEILLGVNQFYVPEESISRLLQQTSLTLHERISRRFNPSVVYVLKNK